MKLAVTVAFTGALAAAAGECDTPATVDLALTHAPVHYQDTDNSSALSDRLTAIDYDGNWDTTDNWDNLADASTWTTGTDAVVYRSVVETCTQWYIVYMMYHPRDWTDVPFGFEHENDAEGALVVVTKDGTPTGRVDAMVTVYHEDFYSFVPAGGTWTDGDEDVDGTLSFATVDGALHPMTSQQSNGHGMQAWPYAGNFAGNPGEDGISYLPGTVAESPPSDDSRDVRYALVNLFESVWFLQLTDSAPFGGDWGTLNGDGSGTCGDDTPFCSDDAAHMPWAWDDVGVFPGEGDDLPGGMLALDPATLVDAYFGNTGALDLDYVSNKYLEDLQNSGYTDAFLPTGFPDGLSLDEAYTRLGAVCP
ncbi:MAG: hypothetical protein ABMB14_29605 [Myxococcota bacterium]